MLYDKIEILYKNVTFKLEISIVVWFLFLTGRIQEVFKD